MNNTDFFVNPLQTYNFISILSSVNILSNILNKEKLLRVDDRFRPIPIVNSLCEYLHKNNNSENATILLGKKWINNTDLYGSKENETIHFQYVEAMIDHFIASVVFSKFGNSFGYLSAIVNATKNLTLPFVKRKIALDLREQIFFDQDYRYFTLTQISVKRITKKLIFPLFPQPGQENSLRIVDVDYIYAQAGLMLARSVGINSQNTSFEEYIVMAQSVKQSIHRGELNEDALKIFQLPALLYYTYKRKKEFKKDTFDINIASPNFWNETFINLFTHLKAEQQKVEELQKTNVFSQLEKALFVYKNRSEYAEYLLRRLCPLDSESEYEEEVVEYKFYYSDYHCKKDNFKMPNLNELFSQQNEYIAYCYFLVESLLLEQTFGERQIELIKKPDVAVWPLEIYRKRRSGFRNVPFRENLKDNIVLFAIEEFGGFSIIYALIRENTTMTILSAKNDRDGFMQKIGLKNSTKLVIPRNALPLKYYKQSFKVLLKNLLQPRKKALYNLLQSQGYNPTTGESIIDFLKMFVPFYNCIKNIKTQIVMNAVGACIVDSLSLIPIFGLVASTGLKFAKAAMTPLLVNFQTSMKSFSIGQFVSMSLNFGIKSFAVQASKEISKQITKELFKDIGKSVLRTLDPGIELSYLIGKAGVASITKCFSTIGKKVLMLSRVLKSLSKVKQPVITQVGMFKGHKVYVNSISGKDGYGVKFFNFNGETVELRRIRGYKREMPVVLVSNPEESKRIYQIKNIKTGELEATRWEFRNDILVVEVKPFAVRVKTIQVEGLSGRGGVIKPRINIRQTMIKKRKETVLEWKPFIKESVIRDVLKKFVLEDTEITQKLFEFVVTHKKTPTWSKVYELTNRENYEFLRYSTYMDDAILTKSSILERADDLYIGKYRMDSCDIDPLAMYEIYFTDNLHTILSFQDFLAIGSYVMNSPGRVFVDSVQGWYTYNAFNKLSLRMIDFPTYDVTKPFFKVEKSTVENVQKFKIGEHRAFPTIVNLDSEISQSLERIGEGVSGGSSVNILYEILLDNHYMAVNVENIIPRTKTSAILLTETVFQVLCAEHKVIEGKEVFKVSLKNMPIDKAEWAAKLNRNIETLNNRINNHNTVLDDFDLSELVDDSILNDFDLSLLD